MVFSNIFHFHPTWGNDQFWRPYFSQGLVQPPTSNFLQNQTAFFWPPPCFFLTPPAFFWHPPRSILTPCRFKVFLLYGHIFNFLGFFRLFTTPVAASKGVVCFMHGSHAERLLKLRRSFWCGPCLPQHCCESWNRRVARVENDLTLSIQLCPKKGINPTILLWGWDWDHQTYSREGYGCLGSKPQDELVLKIPAGLVIEGMNHGHPVIQGA